MDRVRRRFKKDCSGKYKYRRFCEAVRAADDYNDWMGMVEAPMVAYRCAVHGAFHKGHDTWMTERSAGVYLVWSRTRSWARRASSWFAGSSSYALSAEVDRLALARLRIRKHVLTG